MNDLLCKDMMDEVYVISHVISKCVGMRACVYVCVWEWHKCYSILCAHGWDGYGRRKRLLPYPPISPLKLEHGLIISFQLFSWRWLISCHVITIEVLWVKSRYQGQEQVITSHRYSISQEICTWFLLCCALLWLYIDWFSHIHQAYFTGTVAI